MYIIYKVCRKNHKGIDGSVYQHNTLQQYKCEFICVDKCRLRLECTQPLHIHIQYRPNRSISSMNLCFSSTAGSDDDDDEWLCTSAVEDANNQTAGKGNAGSMNSNAKLQK